MDLVGIVEIGGNGDGAVGAGGEPAFEAIRSATLRIISGRSASGDQRRRSWRIEREAPSDLRPHSGMIG